MKIYRLIKTFRGCESVPFILYIMIRLDYPLRKKYISIIKTKYWDVSLFYKQWTLLDTMSFLNDNTKDYNVLNSMLEWIKVKKRLKYIYISKKTIIKEAFDHIEEYINKIAKNMFVWLFEKKAKWWKWWRKTIFSASLQTICEKYNLSPISVLEEYTREQYERLCDWIIFNANEWDKKWQRLNNRYFIKNNTSKKSDEELLEQLISENKNG